MPLGPMYTWCMQTKQVESIAFYTSPHQYKQSMASFEVGDAFEIDACGNQQLHDLYPTSEDDNSFVLVPKGEVVRIWSQERNPPVRIKMKNTG